MPGQLALFLPTPTTCVQVTPLLSQWTYQAMLHELIGMEDNTVDLTPPNKAGKEEDKVIFSRYQDDFYANNVHADFGSLGEAVRTLMAELAKQTPQVRCGGRVGRIAQRAQEAGAGRGSPSTRTGPSLGRVKAL